jgi:hypothetical protein
VQNENVQNENVQNENVQNENVQNENVQNENVQNENVWICTMIPKTNPLVAMYKPTDPYHHLLHFKVLLLRVHCFLNKAFTEV